ncbi:MAG: phospholipase [Campylobacteraceae bacterium]|nr:phospholipase [Campylobacteraceae bacterium]
MELNQLLLHYLVYTLGGLAILLTLLHMLYARRSPTSMTLWLLLMIIAPYIFVIFYYIFGLRKRSIFKDKSLIFDKKIEISSKPPLHQDSKLLFFNNIPPASNDNDLKLFTNSSKSYNEFIKALKGAKESIDLATYVLKFDEEISKIFEILTLKAREGVKVRFLIDTLGSYKLYFWQKPLKELKKAGVKIHFFSPIFNKKAISKLNLRYHRKIYIIDNKILFSGGMNLSGEYMGAQECSDRWIDLMFKVEGSVVNDYIDIFNLDLSFVCKKDLTRTLKNQEKAGDHLLQTLPSGPDVKGDVLLELIIDSIYRAKKRIWIITPYFIPDESIMQALRIASHKNVDVRIITPQKSNHKIADLARKSYIRTLYENSIKVILYEGKMIHAKALLFDESSLILGSSNLDYRSLLLNYEVVTISYAKDHILQIEEWMRGLMAKKYSKLEPANKLKRIFENLFRIFASAL